MKNRLLVEIGGREFALRTDESEEYMKSVATDVNQMINDIVLKSMRMSKNDAALLICLELCDNNKKLSEANDNMRKQMSEYIDEINRLKKYLTRDDRPKYDENTQPQAETEKEIISDEVDISSQENHEINDEDLEIAEPEVIPEEKPIENIIEEEVAVDSSDSDTFVADAEENKDDGIQQQEQQEVAAESERRETSAESLREKFNRLQKKMSESK